MNSKTQSKNFNYQFMVMLVLTSLLNGCGITDGFGLFAEEPEPTPVYTIDLNISAGNKLNPDLENRASPVVLRIYQLKSGDTLKNSDFFEVYENDEVLLGKDITYRKELELKPNDELVLSSKLKEETLFLGVFAAFRDLDEAVWQLVVEIKPEHTNSFEVSLDQFVVAIKDGDGGNKNAEGEEIESEDAEAKKEKIKEEEAKKEAKKDEDTEIKTKEEVEAERAAEAEPKTESGARGAGEEKSEPSLLDSLFESSTEGEKESSWLDTVLEYIGLVPNPATVADELK